MKNEIINSILVARISAPLVEHKEISKLFEPLIKTIKGLDAIRLNIDFYEQHITVGQISDECQPVDRYSITFSDLTLGSMDAFTSSSIGESDKDFIEVTLNTFAATWQKSWMLHVVESLTSSVAFEGNMYEYNSRLAKVIQNIFFCEHVFVREKIGTSFACVGYAGSSRIDTFSEHEISRGSNPLVFNMLDKIVEHAAELDSTSSTTQKIDDDNCELLELVNGIVQAENIRCALIVPLVVGGTSRGVVSLLFEDHSTARLIQNEVLALVANHIAVAISHYEKAKLLAQDRSDKALQAMDSLNFELIQGIRHSAANNVASAKMSFHRLAAQLKIPSSSDKSNPISMLRDDLELLTVDMTSMEELVKQRSLEHETAHQTKLQNVSDLFQSVASTLEHRLNPRRSKRKILVRIQAPPLYILCNRIALKYAFANIIINSIRAISDSNSKSNAPGGQYILFVGVDQRDRIQIDLSDTGGGVPIGQGSIRRLGDIWEAGRTSKKDGTGFGLAYVRDAIQVINNGTIEIHENLPNLTLRIVLPKYTDGGQDLYDKEMKKIKN